MQIRQPAVAGMFYPADRATLAADVDAMLSGAARAQQNSIVPKAIIVPHAGYVYSGKVAGYTFRALRDNAAAAGAPQLVVILGFSQSRGSRRAPSGRGHRAGGSVRCRRCGWGR